MSPTQTAIDELNKQILDEFAQKFYEKYPLEQGKEKGAELFELLSLLYNQKELLLENKISCSTGTMRAEYNKSDREDTSKTNRASIAFVWEFGKKRILLLEDATSEVVIEGIRFDNLYERIGKKYQWKALFAVEAELMDHFAITDKWHKEADGNKRILRPPYPWYSSTLNDFDVTLTKELIDDAEIDDVLDKQSQFVIDKQMEDHEWLEQPVTTIDCQHFFVGEDNKWVLLFGIFSEYPTNGESKNAYLPYETFFVRNEDAQKFEDWISKQNFNGIEMPTTRSSDIRLFEYPWMLHYISTEYKNWTDVSAGDDNCPCSVMVTNFTQLQANVIGLRRTLHLHSEARLTHKHNNIHVLGNVATAPVANAMGNGLHRATP